MDISAKLEAIKGVGPKTAEALEKRGFRTIKDLLYYFPRSYEDYQSQTNIADIKPGRVILRGKIRNLKNIRTRRRNFTITQGEIYDETGAVRVVWYNQPYRIKNFDEKTTYYFTGQYDFKYNRYQITAPTVALAAEIEQKVEGFQPIYSAKGSFNSAWFKKLFEKIRISFITPVPDLIPLTSAPTYVKKGTRNQALFQIHFPKKIEEVEQAKKYLGYEEVFELILASQLNRQENQKLRAMPLSFNLDLTKQFLKSLPFELTAAQKTAAWEIMQDLTKSIPMNRLLQGDVGSGKTIVAALAILQAVNQGAQVALLAPTAILASQHAENLTKILSPFKVKTELLIGATKQKEQLKQQIKNGEIDLIIGTHALLTDDTVFQNLALCIIDEQHRFGVAQRQKLLEKVALNQQNRSVDEKVALNQQNRPVDDKTTKQNEKYTAPHFLAMTATPIPRSLQLTIFGDLDVSIINQMPKGRQGVQTKIINETNMREMLYPEITRHLEVGEQIYWICRLIEQDQDDPLEKDQRTVKEEAKRLKKIFPKYKIGILHGRMKASEKDQVMNEFKTHQLDILVSTTVVEVGVDVPNATQIVIMNADRFGLAQAHQLRGRVGRGQKASQCFLITTGDNPPSARLRELEKSNNGFYLAEVDLKLRGPGEVYGSMQHGELNLQIANLADIELIKDARAQAVKVAANPENMLKYKELSQSIKRYQQLTTLN